MQPMPSEGCGSHMVSAEFLKSLILLDNFRSDFTARADFAGFRETILCRAKFFQIRRF